MAGLYFSLFNLVVFTLQVGLMVGVKANEQNSFTKSIFPIHPLNAPVDEGNSVILDCIANLTKVKECYWVRDNAYRVTPSISSGYILLGNMDKSECSMKIEKATVNKDDGEWVCEANNGYRSFKSNPANITVLRPPTSVIMFKDNQIFSQNNSEILNITFFLGETINGSLTCVSKRSNPETNIVWLRDLDQIDSDRTIQKEDPRNKTYTVTSYPKFNVTVDYHKKIIRCRVMDWNNDFVMERFFFMLVEHPTSLVEAWPIAQTPSITQPTLEITVQVNYPEIIECKANGYPSPTITWTKISNGEEKLVAVGPTLLVGNDTTDEGLYRCQASNTMNNRSVGSTHNIRVTVEYPTSNVTINHEHSKVMTEGGQIHLECKANGFPRPQILWHKKKGNSWINVMMGKSYVINQFTSEEQGFYRCSAFNVHNSKEVVSVPVHLYLEKDVVVYATVPTGLDAHSEPSSTSRIHPLRPFYVFLIYIAVNCVHFLK